MNIGSISILTGVNSDGQAVIIQAGHDVGKLRELAKSLADTFTGMMITGMDLSEEFSTDAD